MLLSLAQEIEVSDAREVFDRAHLDAPVRARGRARRAPVIAPCLKRVCRALVFGHSAQVYLREAVILAVQLHFSVSPQFDVPARVLPDLDIAAHQSAILRRIVPNAHRSVLLCRQRLRHVQCQTNLPVLARRPTHPYGSAGCAACPGPRPQFRE